MFLYIYIYIHWYLFQVIDFKTTLLEYRKLKGFFTSHIYSKDNILSPNTFRHEK